MSEGKEQGCGGIAGWAGRGSVLPAGERVKNQWAVKLGKLARGVKKNLTDEERARRAERMRAGQRKRAEQQRAMNAARESGKGVGGLG